MALRLYSEFNSSTDKLFKIEIHDTSFTGTAESFPVASNGFDLNYSGETDDIVSPIIGSNCTISAFNTSAAFDSFISALKGYQESRFFIRIYAEAATIEDGLVMSYYDTQLPPDNGMVLYWTGVIMQDLITIEDISKPSIFNITAVDGIGHLANKDYEWFTYENLEGFLERAVGAIGMNSLYADDDLLYATSVNIWDTKHTYNATTDVTTLIRYYAPTLRTRETNGAIIFPKYLDVLKELCIAFGARFYQREGVFYFEQYIERTETSRNVSAYYKNGTKAFTSSVSDDVTLNGTTIGGARLAGNSFNFLPALKKVEVRHNKKIRENLLGKLLAFYTITAAQDLGVLGTQNSAYLQITGNLNYRLFNPIPPAPTNLGFFRARFRIEVKIEDQLNPGTYYYLNRPWSPVGGQLYSATNWTTTASYYYLDTSLVRNSAAGVTVSHSFNLVTPPLPVDGEATIDIEQNGLYNENNNSVSVPTGYGAGWDVQDVLVSYKSDQADSISTLYLSSNGSTNVKSNLVLDLGEVRLADAFGGPGSFDVYTGSTWEPSSNWRRGNSGGYEALLSLLTKEVLSLHSKPIERYSGTIVGPYPFGVRYSFDSAYWLPMQGTYNANIDEWSSEWFKVQRDDSDVVIDSPVDGDNYGDVALRVSTSQGTDEFINAVKVTTTTSAVTGNETVGGTLGVTGISTLAATNVGEFTTTSRVNVTINDITANDGGGENLSSNSNFNFITYEGNNGTYTINLPEAGEGLILRFKTDDTIAANKTITLQPQSGGRIDAESTYVMNRSYDGVTLLGRGGDNKWFIIQKKEK